MTKDEHMKKIGSIADKVVNELCILVPDNTHFAVIIFSDKYGNASYQGSVSREVMAAAFYQAADSLMNKHDELECNERFIPKSDF